MARTYILSALLVLRLSWRRRRFCRTREDITICSQEWGGSCWEQDLWQGRVTLTSVSRRTRSRSPIHNQPCAKRPSNAERMRVQLRSNYNDPGYHRWNTRGHVHMRQPNYLNDDIDRCLSEAKVTLGNLSFRLGLRILPWALGCPKWKHTRPKNINCSMKWTTT